MACWLDQLLDLIGSEPAVARVTILGADAPTPREIGSTMLVTAAGTFGRIGRGPLEVAAVEAARKMIAERGDTGAPRWRREIVSCATGAVLGESSNGSIVVLIEVLTRAEVDVLGEDVLREEGVLLTRPLADGVPLRALGERDAVTGLGSDIARAVVRLRGQPNLNRVLSAAGVGHDAWLVERARPWITPFLVYGTGRVARALVEVLAGLPFAVRWIDSAPANFPEAVPSDVSIEVAEDVLAVAASAPAGAFHAVMTVSHDLDYAVCRAVLAAGTFGYLGVKGSAMKRERLGARLARDGVAAEAIARVSCPIGLAGIRAKQPSVIAVSIAAEALLVQDAIEKAMEEASGV